MEQLLRKSTVQFTGRLLDSQEECPISGEYNLPEYCSDVAVVLKCFADPRIQNRQWSGEQLLLDGNVVVRVWYLGEDRHRLCTLEFALPFSCAIQGKGRGDNASAELELCTKYLNCRAVSPRRVEVRGAVSIRVESDCVASKNLAAASDSSGLHARTETVEVTIPRTSCEKILSISESLELDTSLPPVEMLLGGECHAVLQECKFLAGKAIIKGQAYIHQLYVDATEHRGVHSLTYTLPFSQIMDIPEAQEGFPYKESVQVLSDTERCSVGPDGENTMLDVSVKLLVQVQLYRREEICFLKEAYHSRFPIAVDTEDVEVCALLDSRWESTVLPMQLTVAAGRWSELLDVIVQPQAATTECRDGIGDVRGRMMICVVARDVDGEIVYDEFVEEYGLQYNCRGNKMCVRPAVMEVHYRVVEEKLELQVKLCVGIREYSQYSHKVISDLQADCNQPYPQPKVTALFYYGDSGESVWDIGRNCHASPACIMEENTLTDECLCENTIVVVPMLT